MNLSTIVIAIVLLASRSNGDYDVNFCTSLIGQIDEEDDQGIQPVFYDNFYVFIEVKDPQSRSVIYEDEYFSKQAGIVYGTLRGQVNQNQTWVDANTGEIISGPLGQDICTVKPLIGTTTAKLLGVTVNAAGNVSLNTPDAALGWTPANQKIKKNNGQGSARGITTDVWLVCTFDATTNITSVSEWHVVDPSLTLMPVVRKDQVLKPILPVLVKIQSIDHSNPQKPVNTSSRIDFTFFDNVQPTDEIFQTPPTMLCSTKPSAQVPLPTAPSYFKFKGEQITITTTDNQNSLTDLVYTVEEYSQLSQLFIQDFITKPSNPNSGNDKSYIRNIDDFSTGLTFEVHLISGTCLVSVISPEQVDSVPLAGGKVTMRTSQQFFDLDSNQYQYMGIHPKRGITCDVWSAYFTDGQSDHTQNALYTWYFANAQWMQNNGFQNTGPLPVTLEVSVDNEFVQFNMYEFDTQDAMKLPDVSLCFDLNSTLDIDFHISASYTQMVAPDVQAFYKAIYDTVVLATSLVSVLRITDMDVQPASSSDIIVRFKLLDISTIKTRGDVSVPQKDAPNSQILADLCSAINSGTFTIDITSTSDSGATGKKTVTVQKYSCGQCPGGPGSNTSLPGQSTLLPGKSTSLPGQSTLPRQSTLPGQSTSLVGPTLASLTQPTTVTEQSWQYYNSQSSGYSAGSMAGIGIGMLALGILLGGVIVVSVRKFKRPMPKEEFSMKKLEEIK